jgi:hypothetical protein
MRTERDLKIDYFFCYIAIYKHMNTCVIFCKEIRSFQYENKYDKSAFTRFIPE